MPDSVNTVKEELVSWFGDKISTSPYFDDFAAIGSYLSDPNQYRDGLQDLQNDMEARFFTRLDQLMPAPVMAQVFNRPATEARAKLRLRLPHVYRGIGQNRAAIDRKKLDLKSLSILVFRKILTDTLKANEVNNGFLSTDSGKIDIFIGFPEVVDGKSEFNDFLRARKQFKDMSAGKEHGEYSHRIQWYLISKLGTLAHSVAEIYSKLPPFRTVELTEPRSFYLWEYLVDRDGVPSNAAVIPFKTTEQIDFRAPSNLNRCLKDGMVFPQFDLLSAVLSERWDRRDRLFMDDYLAKKIFSKEALSGLTEETMEMLRQEIGAGGAYRILKR